MATIQESSNAPWRKKLVPAQYGAARYHVEHQARSSGRRVVTHEYPKRDRPYAEDMGRHAIRYNVQGYVVGPNYNEEKELLVSELESPDGKPLIDPYLGGVELFCICERYSVTEVRERGGYCVFDMSFVEVGLPGNSNIRTDTRSDVENKAKTTAEQSAALLDNVQQGLGG